MSNAAEHEPLPQPGAEAVGAIVLADIQARIDAGYQKYGTLLQTFNGRDALWDSLQEAIDLVMYLRQAILERDARQTEKAAATPLVYLASPLSHPDPAVLEARFRAVCHAASRLMQEGNIIFAPIVHSFPIVTNVPGTPWTYEFWLKQDFALLDVCAELWVLRLPGWVYSHGIAAEIKHAEAHRKPIRFVDATEEEARLAALPGEDAQ
jgi:hypothetical protein